MNNPIFFNRRVILHLGTLGPMGLPFSFVDGAFSSRVRGGIGSAKSCILLWLDGGPSHLEMFDPKPEAPIEVRGPFGALRTTIPGIVIGELLPETAKVCDKFAIIRSVTSPLGEHGLANQYMLTGFKPSTIAHPSYGAVQQFVKPSMTDLPPYVSIPESAGLEAGFLGAEFEPFSVGGDPSQKNFEVRDLQPAMGLDRSRILRRKEFSTKFSFFRRSDLTSGLDTDPTMDRAFRLVLSPSAKRAFDLERESEVTRQRYGDRSFGQSCLLARRLIEQGVRFVTVRYKGWDTHENLKLHLRDGYSGAKVGVGLVPTFDRAFSALLCDLEERRMLDETLVIAMGEFGRTPKLNARGGRDHWPRVFSVAMAGGGVRGGQVIGRSDFTGESPVENAVTPSDLAYSVFRLLGIDPTMELTTPDGRPIPVNQGGAWIEGLA
jgi:uncharacterized protein (DUF1501 family)